MPSARTSCQPWRGRGLPFCALLAFASAFTAAVALLLAMLSPAAALADDDLPINVGTHFTAKVQLRSQSGDVTDIDCGFEITDSANQTCSIIGAGAYAGSRAIATSSAGTLVVPSSVSYAGNYYTVTEVGNYAFGGVPSTSCSKLTGVELPSTVKTIGAYAFASCTGLKGLATGSAIATIGDHAYYQCTGLPAKLSFPKNVRLIKAYAFTRATGLRTVVFEGNAPNVEKYAFTGSGMVIANVVFYGTGISDITGLFNSDLVAPPICYYKVTFYPNEDSMRMHIGELGWALVSSNLAYRQLSVDLPRAGNIYDGSIPEWPEETNVWQFADIEANALSRNARVDRSSYAYASWSRYRDLSYATSYVTPGTEAQYTGFENRYTLAVTDFMGGAIDKSELDFTYERKTGRTTWEPTEDLVSPGTIRVTATPVATSRYYGSVRGTYEIVFGLGSNFRAPLEHIAVDGTHDTVPCWVKVTSFGGSDGKGPYTLSLAAGNRGFADEETGEPIYLHTVESGFTGELVLPETIEACGYTFTLTGIDYAAFGLDKNLQRPVAATGLTRINIPKTIKSIGDQAFAGCTGLKFLEFAGDASQIAFGSDKVFSGCSSLAEIVWRDKKPTSRYLLAERTLNAKPLNYYTVRYYSSAQTSGGTPIGQVTLSENVTLAFAGLANTREKGLWDGQIPPLPSELIDDGKWFAPYWVFPEVDDDNYKALQMTLSDSTYAYGEQTNDAYHLDDIIVSGIEPGKVYDYNGLPVIGLYDIHVATAYGRLLTPDIDYSIAVQRKGKDGVWADSTDIVNGGDLRLAIRGIRPYTSGRDIEFSIKAPPVNVGTQFAAPIEVVAADGTAKTYSTWYRVTGVAQVDETGAEVSADTVEIAGTRGINGAELAYPLIDSTARGLLEVPETVWYQGREFTVTSIGNNAFSGCSGLTSLTMGQNIADIGSYAFSGCSRLASAQIHGMTGNSEYAFNGCYMLKQATVEDSWAIPRGAFMSCSQLRDIDICDTVRLFGDSAFASTPDLKRIVLPTGIQTIASTAFGSGNSNLKTVAFKEGTLAVLGGLFANNRQVTHVELPSTLIYIGEQAFSGSGLIDLTVPADVVVIGDNAFFGCTSLARIVFEGDANSTTQNRPFTLCRSIESVVFWDDAPISPSIVFPSNTARFYGMVRYYADEQAAFAGGEPLGRAAIELGTSLRAVNEGTVPAGKILEGEQVALPEGATMWGFEGNPPLSGTLNRGLRAYARGIDPADISYGHVAINEGYRYTGGNVRPFESGSAQLENALGYPLTYGTHYTVTYQRRDAEGNWADSNDQARRGRVRAVLTAVEGSGYTGQISAEYIITSYMVGESFICTDVNDHDIRYYVTALADDGLAGAATVGIGDKSQQAISESSEGVVVIPEVATDSAGMRYRVTAISDYALYRRMGVTGVVIPDNVETIGTMAFAYERIKTDTRLSSLATVEMTGDMTDVQVAYDAFTGCNVVRDVVYGGRKGSMPAYGGSTGYNVWYTVRYYLSPEDRAAGNVAATVVMRHGAFPDSPARTEIREGSDEIPQLDESVYEWVYEAGSLDAEGRICDSMGVVAREKNQDIIVAQVPYAGAQGESAADTAEVAFTKLRDLEGNYTGQAAVGYLEDGRPAMSASAAGTVTIPASVTDRDGTEFAVTQVGEYAFGSSDAPEAACALSGIELPASIASIGPGAFENCASLASVAFAEDSQLAAIDGAAFRGCSSLTTIALPEGLASIGSSAFAESGLVRVRVPWSVATLGKRAFSGCPRLEEAVIGGAMALSLPAPSDGSLLWQALAAAGDPSSPQPGAESQASNASGLEVLDDYTFANCAKLRRVVFDADMARVVMSPEAFEGCEAIEAVVFGDKRTSATYGASRPTLLYTFSYFADEAAQRALDRQNYLVLPAGATYAEGETEGIYAGSYLGVPEHWEWIYDGDISMTVRESMYAYARKIRYDIDSSAVDGAFAVTASVDGEPRVWGNYDDQVELAVTGTGKAAITQVRIVDTSTDEELASFVPATDGTVSGTFTMPAAKVRVEVAAELKLDVYVQSPILGQRKAGTLKLADMEALAKAGKTDGASRYSAWNANGQAVVVTAGGRVDISALMKKLGIVFDPGDTLYLMDGEEILGSVSYSELYAKRRYYPNLGSMDAEGAEAIAPAIAIRSTTDSYTDVRAGNVGTPSLAPSYQLLFGQTEAQALSNVDTASSLLTGITAITVLQGAEDISGFTVSGLKPYYIATGKAIEPAVTVRSDEFGKLKRDRDYELEFSDNVEPGLATVKVKGVGRYKGTAKATFKIVETVTISGTNRYATAADVAVEAYPSGSAGAIVVTGANFPDALAASSLSGLKGYPVLLTATDALSPETRDALGYLRNGKKNFRVIILGGYGSVSKKAEQQILKVCDNQANSIMRFPGSSRYDTCMMVYEYGGAANWSDTAIVASGVSFADALSISSYAAWSHSPIFLSDGADISAEMLALMRRGSFKRVVIVGGESSVPALVAKKAGGIVGSKNVVRLAGSNRFETSKRIAEWSLKQGMNTHTVYVSSGQSFPDGLVGGPAAARTGSVMLLAMQGSTGAFDVLDGYRDKVYKLVFLGGDSSVSRAVKTVAIGKLGWGSAVLRA